MRDLLNSLPESLLALMFVVLTVLVTLGALALVRTYLPTWRTTQAVEGVIGIAAMVMTLFALVLAFVVVNLYSDYNNAVVDVTDEANSLGAMVQDARAFSPAGRRSIDRAIAQYVIEVRGPEFRKLADGSTDPRAQQLVVGVVDAFQAYRPVTSTQTAFYRAAADEINTFLGERENRLNKAETIIPPPLLILLVFLAVTTIAVSLLISTGHLGIDIALITTLAIVIAAGFATGLILQYPYSGSIAVSSVAFSHGSLSQLPGLGG
jgi:Protein of unknown function (DUF4239)